MSFKKELEKIQIDLVKKVLDHSTNRMPGEVQMYKMYVDTALTSIINLVDKSLPEKKRDFPYPGENIQAASHAGYNQAIDDMRNKLRGE